MTTGADHHLTEVVIFGAGGHAKVAIALLRDMGAVATACYDDDPAQTGRDLSGVPVAGTTSDYTMLKPVHIAIGANAVRSRLVERHPHLSWAKIISPRALMAAPPVIGEGTMIGLGAMIQVDARIGRHVIVNTGSIVEHDCEVGDFVHLAPGSILAGGAKVGAGALIGVGARVLPGISVGEWAVVGAGSVVVESVPPHAVVVGSPARRLEKAAEKRNQIRVGRV